MNIQKKLSTIPTIAIAAIAIGSSDTFGVVILGGNAQQYIQQSLNNLGTVYTTSASETPNPAGLGAGDIIIISNDGGFGPYTNYTSFLNSGGDVIVVGGSNDNPYRTWASLYFNLTDTATGWHTDGAWHKSVNLPATSSLPANYTFGQAAMTYHMLGFAATPNTVMLGTNDEGVNIAALRSYTNNGTLNYMALDIGKYGSPSDLTAFTQPWVQNALSSAMLPEPVTVGMIGIASIGLLQRRRRVA